MPAGTTLFADSASYSANICLHHCCLLSQERLAEQDRSGLSEVQEYLQGVDTTLEQLKEVVLAALSSDDAEARLSVRMHGTDNQINADVTDLIEAAAKLCGQQLTWSGKPELEQIRSRASSDILQGDDWCASQLVRHESGLAHADKQGGDAPKKWARAKMAARTLAQLNRKRTIFVACHEPTGGEFARLLQQRSTRRTLTHATCRLRQRAAQACKSL